MVSRTALSASFLLALFTFFSACSGESQSQSSSGDEQETTTGIIEKSDINSDYIIEAESLSDFETLKLDTSVQVAGMQLHLTAEINPDVVLEDTTKRHDGKMVIKREFQRMLKISAEGRKSFEMKLTAADFGAFKLPGSINKSLFERPQYLHYVKEKGVMVIRLTIGWDEFALLLADDGKQVDLIRNSPNNGSMCRDGFRVSENGKFIGLCSGVYDLTAMAFNPFPFDPVFMDVSQNRMMVQAWPNVYVYDNTGKKFVWEADYCAGGDCSKGWIELDEKGNFLAINQEGKLEVFNIKNPVKKQVYKLAEEDLPADADLDQLIPVTTGMVPSYVLMDELVPVKLYVDT